MGIIVTIEYAAGNVMLQLSGKTEAAKWLPLLPAENGITEKMLLADGKGGVSLVVSETELTGLLTVLPGDMQPDMQSVGLVEITGAGAGLRHMGQGIYRAEAAAEGGKGFFSAQVIIDGKRLGKIALHRSAGNTFRVAADALNAPGIPEKIQIQIVFIMLQAAARNQLLLVPF